MAWHLPVSTGAPLGFLRVGDSGQCIWVMWQLGAQALCAPYFLEATWVGFLHDDESQETCRCSGKNNVAALLKDKHHQPAS